jgi:tRNA (cmo5U34)-methyltransferase
VSKQEAPIPKYVGPDTSGRTDKLTREEIRNRFDSEVASLYSQRDPVWLPDFKYMFSLVPQVVGPFLGKDGLLLDIGAGTGNLTRSVIEKVPDAKAVLMDFSANMLSAVPQVLGQFEGRFQTITADFMDYDLGSFLYSAVISSFAIHHCRGLQEYGSLYRKIWRSLREPGVFACCDVVSGANRQMSDNNEAEWTAFLESQGLEPVQIERILSNYRTEDSPSSLWTHLSLMSDAGFRSVDVIWKKANFAVYAGFK